MSDFDPYLQWLGIPPEEQPPDHYRLLGIRRFQSDPVLIQSAAEQRMAIVRSYQTGPRGAATQALLNQLAAAKLCLLDPYSKSEYDGTLSRQVGDSSIADSMLPTSVSIQPPPFAVRTPVPVSIDTQTKSADVRSNKSLALGWLPAIGMLLAVVAGLSIWFVTVALDAPNESVSNATKTEGPATTQESGEAATVESGADQLPLTQESDGIVDFSMSDAKLDGQVTLESREDGSFLVGWQSDADFATWRFKISKLPSQGIFRVRVTYHANPEAEGSQYVLTLDDASQTRDVRARNQVLDDAFYLSIKRSGEHTLRFSLQNKPPSGTFGLKRLEFWVPKVGGSS